MNIDVIYSERYNEMRRFRDYELTASTWYSAILLAILGFVASTKFDHESLLFNPLNMNIATQILIAIGVLIVGICGVYSICYVSYRYQELRNYMDIFVESDDFKPHPFPVKPLHAILLTQLILIGAINFVLLAPPVCNGIIASIVSIFFVLIIWITFFYLEKNRKLELQKLRLEEERKKLKNVAEQE